ncbi:hypothetical protein SAMN02745751_02218 [Dethiosulfatibacter aminovorans DSM 17477]|uniref:Uncharacterized protein n=1 Tax=Dethiosulfatibacter aminovorans DSM 17477 TaxID=1121476 RepID=A0A1M6I4T7_9FIRM|nr:hypothetical protein SAMN02745751_02218 [Dethiosulfatibacter aminovorans DSM 17477]
MKLKYKDKFRKDLLYRYLGKLKSFDFEKFPVVKAMMNYFKKAKMIVFISLFFCFAWNWNHRGKHHDAWKLSRI